MERKNHFLKTKGALTVAGMALSGVVIAAIVALILGVVVLWLWNWLMPEIFGLPAISFWQAWGLVVLSHILFKSFPHKNIHDHNDTWKKNFHNKFFYGEKAERFSSEDLPEG